MSSDADTDSSLRNTMNPDLHKLVRLQAIDTEIQRKETLLVRLPKEIADSYSAAAAAEASLKAFDEAKNADKKRRRSLEQDVETLKAKIASDKSKLPNIKTNVEYRALVKEIEGYEKKIENLDDEQLKLMELEEKVGLGRLPLEAKLNEEKESYARIKADKESAIETVKQKLTELVAERNGVIEGITPSVFAHYERILKSRQGIGVAEVLKQICQACHQIIPPQLYYNIRTTDELISCPHCNRFLYHRLEEDNV